jgi:hypothetical protein
MRNINERTQINDIHLPFELTTSMLLQNEAYIRSIIQILIHLCTNYSFPKRQ